MKHDGYLCKWYSEIEGACFLNGSICCNPFSVEGCEIQCRDIFHEENLEHKHYLPRETNEKIPKFKLWKTLGIKTGDMVADWMMPYIEMEAINADPGIVIHEVKEMVKSKFNNVGIKMDLIRVFHNVELNDDARGLYVIGVAKKGMECNEQS